MAVKIRLMRIGKKRQPSYRVVVKEARSPRAGKYIEQVGYYNPLSEPADVRFDEERVKYWLGVGAQPTETVKRLLAKNTGIELQ
jgi:small subunit ribosomal protein S16